MRPSVDHARQLAPHSPRSRAPTSPHAHVSPPASGHHHARHKPTRHLVAPRTFALSLAPNPRGGPNQPHARTPAHWCAPPTCPSASQPYAASQFAASPHVRRQPTCHNPHTRSPACTPAPNPRPALSSRSNPTTHSPHAHASPRSHASPSSQAPSLRASPTHASLMPHARRQFPAAPTAACTQSVHFRARVHTAHRQLHDAVQHHARAAHAGQLARHCSNTRALTASRARRLPALKAQSHISLHARAHSLASSPRASLPRNAQLARWIRPARLPVPRPHHTPARSPALAQPARPFLRLPALYRCPSARPMPALCNLLL